MIAIRPSIFCFIGRLAPDLYGSVPVAIRRRLGAVPNVFAFVSATADAVDLKIGTRRPKEPLGEGGLQGRLWNAISFASAAIGNIRVRTDALRRPAEDPRGFQVTRGGPDIYLVQCLSDPLGWEVAFAAAEKIHSRNEAPPSAGRARGVFPLFHLPSRDEELERDQALEGVRRLERLVERGVLFPSILLDRVNRNGHPLERWEDLVELVTDFLALGSASEAAGDIWRVFPQVADMHAEEMRFDGGAIGLSAIGLARFRFDRDGLAEELTRFHLRDLRRELVKTFAADPQSPAVDECREFLADLAGRALSASGDGARAAEDAIVRFIGGAELGPEAPSTPLGAWMRSLERLQLALFERLGDVAQRIEMLRQEAESLSLESPLRESWIARVSVAVPASLTYLPSVLGFALLGSLLGLYMHVIGLEGYLLGTGAGALVGFAAAWLSQRRRAREMFTLGEFPESSFTQGFPTPRTLEQHAWKKRPRLLGSGISLELWGEMKSQAEPGERDRVERERTRLLGELAASRKDEAELVFLDRGINALRERVEGWRAALSELEIWESGRGFSGDVFPADGPRRIYEWLRGKEEAEASVAAILSRVDPSARSAHPAEVAEEVSASWGKSKAQALELDKVLEVLEDRPEDLIERLSDASAPLWPRPGDGDELVRIFGDDFARHARPNDFRQSLRHETVFIRVLAGLRSGELSRI